MLEKPALNDEIIQSCVQDEYLLPVNRLTFLPLGADVNTAVYRVDTVLEQAYFLKLRKGDFDEITVAYDNIKDVFICKNIACTLNEHGALPGTHTERRDRHESDLFQGRNSHIL